MANRIKLLVNASGIDEGVEYHIYRDTVSPVGLVTPVMVVDERQCSKRILSKSGEILAQSLDRANEFHVAISFSTVPRPTVYVDGVPVNDSDVMFFAKERLIRITNEPIEPNTTKVVTMDYSYMVSVIEDDYSKAQPGVIHKTTEKITGIQAPISLDYQFDAMTRSLNIAITADTAPKNYRYTMVLKEPKTGRVSLPGPERVMGLTPHARDVEYELEISRDAGVTWNLEFISWTGLFTITEPDRITTAAHVALPVAIVPGSRQAIIEIKNPWYNWMDNVRQSNYYRVRGVEIQSGETTEWLTSTGHGVNFKPIKLKVRRKVHNGAPAQYEGNDAIDIWNIFEADVDPTQEYIMLSDDHLVSGTTYSYTFFIDDEKGYRSLPFMHTTIIS